MLTQEELIEFVATCKRIDSEIQLLQEEKRDLYEDVKGRVSPRVLKEALRTIKVRERLGDEVSQLDALVESLENSV
jgi:hypothetical protein